MMQRFSFGLLVLLLVSLFLSTTLLAEDQVVAEQATDQGGMQVIEGFNRQAIIVSDIVLITDQQKHEILFFMGISLLILLVITATYGIRVGILGKPEFVKHMIFAGLSMTLALAHAVVAIVWFFPF